MTRANMRIRNNEAREQVNKVSKENGISYSFMARLMKVDASSFNHWRASKYEYGMDKLKQVESIVSKYSFNN